MIHFHNHIFYPGHNISAFVLNGNKPTLFIVTNADSDKINLFRVHYASVSRPDLVFLLYHQTAIVPGNMFTKAMLATRFRDQIMMDRFEM